MNMNNEIKIRTAVDKDIEKIYPLIKDVNKMVKQHRLKFFGKLKEFQSPIEFYFKAIKDKNSIIFVAEKGEVVGYVYTTIEKEPDDLIAIPYVNVNELVVKKKYRRLKIGKAMMEKVYEWARQNGLNVIQLAVWEFNRAGVNFYKKLGYETIMRKMEKVLYTKFPQQPTRRPQK